MATAGAAATRPQLGHYSKDGTEVIDVEGEIDISSAPRLRELLIDLVSTTSYQLIVDLDKVGFLDSTGLGGAGRRPEAGAAARRLAGSGLHPGADPEHLPDHRADQGLRHLPDSGPGHRGQEVSNSHRVRGVSEPASAGASGWTCIGTKTRD
jgi:STAS domain